MYSQECNDCLNSAFLLNCKNCTDCFGCVNLRNKNYCIFNEQFTKEDYKNQIEKLWPKTRSEVDAMKKKMAEFSAKQIVPALVENHSTNVSGNWLDECKNVETGFNCQKVEDGKYLFAIIEAKDVMDYTYWGKNSELIYECSSIGYQCSSVYFSNECWDQLIRAQYCVNCHSSSDLFGCVGLRKKQYCILNKQYTKEEYEKLVSQIKDQMDKMPYKDSLQREYRYGSTFPLDMHVFAYNETIAQELFPISKEKALEQGYRWVEPETKNHNITLKAEDVPDSIAKVDEQILKEIIGCAHEGKCNHQCTEAFKITPSDLKFYKRMGIPVPQLCPNCRHFARLSQRTPIKLYNRTCAKCGKDIQTSYAPDRPEIVYCKQCYQSEVV
jgi:CxxC-x17-CxxC domain-containing protein